MLRVSHGRQGRWCWLRAAEGALRSAAPLWRSLVAACVWLVGEGVGIRGVAIGKEALDDAGKAMRPEPSQEPGTRALGNVPQCGGGGGHPASSPGLASRTRAASGQPVSEGGVLVGTL